MFWFVGWVCYSVIVSLGIFIVVILWGLGFLLWSLFYVVVGCKVIEEEEVIVNLVFYIVWLIKLDEIKFLRVVNFNVMNKKNEGILVGEGKRRELEKKS